MKKLFILIAVFIAGFLFAKSWWDRQLAPVLGDNTAKKVVITKGKSVSEIADQLKQENLIRSKTVFILYTRQQGLSSKLSAGTFNLSQGISTPEIIRILSGKPAEKWVTLIEGWRAEEMAEELNSKFKIQNSKFLKLAKEGYMFPDTYLFPNEVTEEQIVKKLGETFDQKYSADLKSKIKAQGLTESEGVILASIVEREARSDKARTMVASILLKRFKIGMGLNADATLQYALGYQPQEKSWWKKHITSEDKKIDSPYNTYLYRGLPPAPIANPSLSSLKAVANVDTETQYLYYYHDSKGNSHYAKTLEEHNENVAIYP